MEILIFLIPISLILGGLGLWGFFWSLRNEQFDDPKGNAARILRRDFDDNPKG